MNNEFTEYAEWDAVYEENKRLYGFRYKDTLQALPGISAGIARSVKDGCTVTESSRIIKYSDDTKLTVPNGIERIISEKET